MKGILVNRALLPGYEPAPAIAHLLAQIEAALTGCRPVGADPETGR